MCFCYILDSHILFYFYIDPGMLWSILGFFLLYLIWVEFLIHKLFDDKTIYLKSWIAFMTFWDFLLYFKCEITFSSNHNFVCLFSWIASQQSRFFLLYLVCYFIEKIFFKRSGLEGFWSWLFFIIVCRKIGNIYAL